MLRLLQNDGALESSETFHLELLWPDGMFIASPASTVVTIVDDDPPAALVNRVAKTGLSGESDAELYYQINVPPGRRTLTVSTTGGSGDVDLYVGAGIVPTTSAYSCRPFRYGNRETCTFRNPVAGNYYIMLHGAEAFNGVSLSARY